MKTIVGVLMGFISCIAWSSEALDEHHEFLSVISQEAATRAWGKVNFSRLSVFNANTSTLTNALSVVALPRFELGTSPLIYFEKGHRYNFSTKINFYRGERWHWALSYGQMKFSLEVPNKGSYSYLQNAASLGFNYFSDLWDLYFSAFGAQNYAEFRGGDLSLPYSKSNGEWGVDVAKRLGERYFVSLGLGQIRVQGYTPFESSEWCLGLNLGMKFPEQFISRPSAGFVYFPSVGAWGLLLSTTFF